MVYHIAYSMFFILEKYFKKKHDGLKKNSSGALLFFNSLLETVINSFFVRTCGLQ
jgi:hypothetical protein